MWAQYHGFCPFGVKVLLAPLTMSDALVWSFQLIVKNQLFVIKCNAVLIFGISRRPQKRRQGDQLASLALYLMNSAKVMLLSSSRCQVKVRGGQADMNSVTTIVRWLQILKVLRGKEIHKFDSHRHTHRQTNSQTDRRTDGWKAISVRLKRAVIYQGHVYHCRRSLDFSRIGIAWNCASNPTDLIRGYA